MLTLIPTHTLFLQKKGKEDKNIFWTLIQLNYVIQFSTLKHLKTNKIISTGSLDFVFFLVQLVLRERTCKLLARFYQRTAMLSILLAQQSGLLRLTLTSTVAKHSAGWWWQQMYWLLCSVESGQSLLTQSTSVVWKLLKGLKQSSQSLMRALFPLISFPDEGQELLW